MVSRERCDLVGEGRRQGQPRELLHRVLRFPTRQAESVAPHQRLDHGHVAGAGADQRVADGELGPEMALRIRGGMRRPTRAEPQGLAEGARIPLVSLHARGPRGVHRGEPGIGHDHLVA